MATLEFKNVVDLTKREISQLKRHTFGPWGSMSPMLDECIKEDESGESKELAQVLILRTDEKEFIGWCLFFQSGLDKRYKKQHEAMFWVRPKFRGKGWGSYLVEEVLKLDPRPFVYPHDQRAGGLFKKWANVVQYDEGEEYLYATN